MARRVRVNFEVGGGGSGEKGAKRMGKKHTSRKCGLSKWSAGTVVGANKQPVRVPVEADALDLGGLGAAAELHQPLRGLART
eukprot:6105588-Pleurochrysis_carterae.AAC.2